MILNEKNEFLKESLEVLEKIYNVISDTKDLILEDLEAKKTVLVVVDVINGFLKEGQMADKRIQNIIEPIVDIKIACGELGIKTIAFADCHNNDAVEFASYPVHCLKNDVESEIVDELKNVGVNHVIEKNSTNGFIEKEFIEWLKNNQEITNFIVVGDCTDICVQQFAITLKTWFNMQNKNSRVIIPLSSVETYNGGLHNAQLMNVMSIYNMMQNGIEIVKNIVRLNDITSYILFNMQNKNSRVTIPCNVAETNE